MEILMTSLLIDIKVIHSFIRPSRQFFLSLFLFFAKWTWCALQISIQIIIHRTIPIDYCDHWLGLENSVNCNWNLSHNWAKPVDQGTVEGSATNRTHSPLQTSQKSRPRECRSQRKEQSDVDTVFRARHCPCSLSHSSHGCQHRTHRSLDLSACRKEGPMSFPTLRKTMITRGKVLTRKHSCLSI